MYKIIILTPQHNTDVERIARVLAMSKDQRTLAVLIGGGRFAVARKILSEAGIPVFNYPERAVEVLCRLAQIKQERVKSSHFVKGFSKIVKNVLAKQEPLTEADIAKILTAYHIPMAESYLTTSANEAIKIAEKIRYPVVLKVTSPDILHKTDAGAIRLNLKTEEEIRKSYQEILKNARKHFPKAKILGVTVHRMEFPVTEIALGAKRDPQFGPVVMFGIGGIYIEIFKDFQFGVAPISVERAKEMLESIKLFPLLAGARGQAPADLEGIAKSISGLSSLMNDFEVIKEIDINPLMANPGEKVLALDAKIIF